MRKTGCRFSGAIALAQIAQAHLRSRSSAVSDPIDSETGSRVLFCRDFVSMSIHRNIAIEMMSVPRNIAIEGANRWPLRGKLL
jgi:hypothetical protein